MKQPDNCPEISVIIPVYNLENYLGPCLESVVAQSYRDFEAIVVNDGSRDASGPIAESFAAQDPRIRVVTTPNQGTNEIPYSGCLSGVLRFFFYIILAILHLERGH